MSLENRRILIVDDEEYIQEILVDLLSEISAEISVCSNGKQALELLQKEEFHVVICDIMMPEMTGLQCFMNSQVRGVLTPFVFLTGFGETSKLLEALRLGAVDFINKPFDPEQVRAVVAKAIEIGVRKLKVAKQIETLDPMVYAESFREEKIISMLRVVNNKKQVAR